MLIPNRRRSSLSSSSLPLPPSLLLSDVSRSSSSSSDELSTAESLLSGLPEELSSSSLEENSSASNMGCLLRTPEREGGGGGGGDRSDEAMEGRREPRKEGGRQEGRREGGRRNGGRGGGILASLSLSAVGGEGGVIRKQAPVDANLSRCREVTFDQSLHNTPEQREEPGPPLTNQSTHGLSLCSQRNPLHSQTSPHTGYPRAVRGTRPSTHKPVHTRAIPVQSEEPPPLTNQSTHGLSLCSRD